MREIVIEDLVESALLHAMHQSAPHCTSAVDPEASESRKQLSSAIGEAEEAPHPADDTPSEENDDESEQIVPYLCCDVGRLDTSGALWLRTTDE